MKKILAILFLANSVLSNVYAQKIPDTKELLLNEYKPQFDGNISYVDIDSDGDPDLIKTKLRNSFNGIWIDDDDDMEYGDLEGDLDNDCLLIDRNGDEIFAGPGDLSIDWIDTNNDGKADIQLVVENTNLMSINYWDYSSNYMWIIDDESDQTFHFIDWKAIVLKCWTHSGASDFFEDYHGQTLFLKTHAPSYCIKDLRVNWENPFLFYDVDDDGLTEMSIRMEDKGEFGHSAMKNNYDVSLNEVINKAYLSVDLDNDNAPSNEFDFDFSIGFEGNGFSYQNQIHQIKNTVISSPKIDSLFYDKRWREVTELIYPSRDSAYNMIFKKGEWNKCWMVFDEDDDCERWERVEFYEPQNPFRIGKNKHGLDNNAQADATGDRGEWDSDNSGNGKLYIGFDGKIHLYGAEKGYWRIDQNAKYYQGWGGLYEGGYKRISDEPKQFPTMAYEDKDGDGFFDMIRYDLDGDTIYERSVNLFEIGVSPHYEIIDTQKFNYKDFHDLFAKISDQMWSNALQSIQVAKKYKINCQWYALLMHPKNNWEKYNNGFWLQSYLFNDLISNFKRNGKEDQIEKAYQAYYSGNWSLFSD